MTVTIDTAFLLAAGLGTRMGELTQNTPKALLKVGGKSLIDRLLDQLAESGVKKAVINLHAHADKAQNHLEKRGTSPNLRFSDERSQLLETGGGLVKALPLLPQNAPFFILNSDVFISGGYPFKTLRRAWRDADMDCLLLLIPKDQAHGHKGAGDFFMGQDGHLKRRGDAQSAPYVFSGIRIIHPRLAQGHKIRPFSFNTFFDKALNKGRLFGVPFDGIWRDVGTKAALAAANKDLQREEV